jgi:hypothetical protein
MTHLLDVNYLPSSYSRYVNLQTSASKEDLDTYQCIQEIPQGFAYNKSQASLKGDLDNRDPSLHRSGSKRHPKIPPLSEVTFLLNWCV